MLRDRFMQVQKFVREVRTELANVVWPTRKETLITTALVCGLAMVSAIFFFAADQIIGVGVRLVFDGRL